MFIRKTLEPADLWCSVTIARDMSSCRGLFSYTSSICSMNDKSRGHHVEEFVPTHKSFENQLPT